MPEIFQFLMALIPIIGLIVALGVFRIPAHWATLGTLLATVLLAGGPFSLNPLFLLSGGIEGGLIALWPIMIVIIAAIYTYNLAVKTGSLDTIKSILSGVTTDKRIQVLILAWGFGGFLEAVAGYGTAVAIPASILAILGFNPLFAAVISLIANTVPTAFGAVGIPVSTLANLTDLDVNLLSYTVGIQLTPFILLIPFALVMLTGRSFKAVKGVFWITLASGISFAIPQLLAASFLGAELPALLGSITSMAVTIALAKILERRKSHKEASDTMELEKHPGMDTGISEPSSGNSFQKGTTPIDSEALADNSKASISKKGKITMGQGFLAWLPYILIFTFILVTSKLVPFISELVDHWKISLDLSLWFGPLEGQKPLVFSFATPGVLIILAAVIGASVQGAKPKDLISIFGKTLIQLWKSTLTVVSILAMAKIMGYSGMIGILASVMVSLTGGFFPLFSPIIGTLGTFVTGSDTSSNILFGELQTSVATSLGSSPYWLAAANTAGATAGKMISPQSIAVATSATGLMGQEGKILSQTILFCLAYVLLLGVLVFLIPPGGLGI